MSHGGFVQSLAFSPDSKLLASIAQSSNLKLWDVATEQAVAERNNTQLGGGPQVAFSPDGILLVADDSGTVRVLKVPSLVEYTNFPGKRPSFLSAGTEVIYIRDGAIRRRDLKSHNEKVVGTDWNVGRVAISPDRRLWAASGGELTSSVRVWNADRPDQFTELSRHVQMIWSLCFSPDGRWLASGSWDGTNRIGSMTDPRQPAVSLVAHNGSAWAAAFSPDGRTLATGGDDNTIRLWQLASFQQAATLREHTASVTGLAFSPDGRLLASGSGDGTVRIWRAPALDEIKSSEVLGIRR
ncbi:MAG: WD40 repeat domain-containing protein [Pedosphaera sp.]|nr:WD40 repeat domain-containing protein [Pedosphaera sp.]